MSPLYDEETGEPNYELTSLEREVFKALTIFTKEQNLDAIIASHLTSYNIGDFSPAIIKAKLKSFEKIGLITKEFDDEGRSAWWEFTPDGAEFAYSLINSSKVLDVKQFLTIDQNLQEVKEAEQALAILSDEIKKSNSLFANREERMQVSKEIDYIRDLILGPRLHVSSFIEIAQNNKTIRFLVTQIASEVVKLAASNVIEKLGPVIRFVRSMMS
ncbi:hypothetical protein [Acidiphilium acidophilum]|uniref:Uncharacterized protein n=1 Tax=Acidiphilium acidophilum TaxID=76588 RepID=A0AAW9DMM2_ACIAO|nr:hypothetical protein [Acidiphilium acidophilum]MDX5930250.1 hypothetical protein [Acidiphilium acidophilum]